MGSENWQTDWRSFERSYKMDNVSIMGTNSYVRRRLQEPAWILTFFDHRNSSSPRLASSSKDGTVRVWSTLTRRTEYTLGGHSASVNVVKWGGAGGPRGVLYTASSDRTVRIWDAEKVRLNSIYHDQISVYEISAGPTTTYLKRTCTLGDNSNS